MSICLTAAAAAAQKSARCESVSRRAACVLGARAVSCRLTGECMRAMLKCQLVCLCAVSRADFEYDAEAGFWPAAMSFYSEFSIF